MRRSVRRPPGDARGKRASAIRVPRSGMGIGPLALLVALHDFVRFVEPPTGHGHASWRQTDSQSHTYLAAPARTSDASNFRLPTSDFRLWTPSHPGRCAGHAQCARSVPGRAGRVVCASLTPGDHARESPCAPQWPVRGRYSMAIQGTRYTCRYNCILPWRDILSAPLLKHRGGNRLSGLGR